MITVDGILIIDKPQGWTSHDVVNFVRRRFSIRKAGHAGTLDPMATGVLVILLGRATKLSNRLTNHYKLYQATLTLGTATDTADSCGKVISTKVLPALDRDQMRDVLQKFTGAIQQVPPMVSAIKFKGKRLYQLARQGKQVPRKPRKVFIRSLRLTEFSPPQVSFEVACSKGTYIRSLCEDIGNLLGCGGHMSYLRRMAQGEFSVEESVSIDDLRRTSQEGISRLVKPLTHSLSPVGRGVGGN